MDTKGINGWLDPEGIFHPCGHGEHYEFAVRHFHSSYLQAVHDLYIPLSSNPNHNNSSIYLPTTVTPKQIEWLRNHMHVMDQRQLELFKQYLHMQE